MQFVIINLKEIEKMRYFNIIKSNDAVVGMISAILLIGLLVMVLSFVNYSYVPQWVENEESSHMEMVSNQFAQLKYAIDIQSLINDNTALTTSIKLSRDEIPFLDPYRNFGSITVKPDRCTFVILDNNGNYYNYTTDSIEFSSQNLYYVNQDYIFEAGAIILAQSNSSVAKGQPSINLIEYGKNLSITFVNITGVRGKSFASGIGTYPIYTRVLSINDQYTTIENVDKLTVFTSYPKAWYTIFNDSLLYSGFSYYINPLDINNRVIVDFGSIPSDNYDIFIKEVKISAQIAWGIV
jgi:hypothetical protein